jgi:uncharacterized peroxidase-related enzyme
MGRLAMIDPATATGRAKELYEGPLKGKKSLMFRSMANSPSAVEMYLSMAQALKGGVLSDKEREVIQLAVGQATGCEYCLAAHTFMGKKAGLSDEQVLEARRGQMKDAKLGAAARLALAIHEKKGVVSDADLAAVRAAGFGDGAIAEIVAAYALAIYTNYFNHVNQTALDMPPAPPI